MNDLKFENDPDSDTDVNITIQSGKFKNITYRYGRVWFPDPNEPVMSFDYDVVSELKPSEKDKHDFEKEIGERLVELIRQSLIDEGVRQQGGQDKIVPPMMNPDAKIITRETHKVPEPEPGTFMSRNLLSGL